MKTDSFTSSINITHQKMDRPLKSVFSWGTSGNNCSLCVCVDRSVWALHNWTYFFFALHCSSSFKFLRGVLSLQRFTSPATYSGWLRAGLWRNINIVVFKPLLWSISYIMLRNFFVFFPWLMFHFQLVVDLLFNVFCLGDVISDKEVTNQQLDLLDTGVF